jgi:Methyltransferase domain
MHFLASSISEAGATLETGAGVSTVLFALKRTNHICVVPSDREVKRIKEFCQANNILTDKLVFEIDYSDQCLPRLTAQNLDLVLIDGGHAFPIPFLDWFYTADRLRVGGLLMIDDTHIWSGHALKMFLLQESEWKLEIDFAPKTVVFRKVGVPEWRKDSWDQPYVTEQTLDLMFGQHPEYVEMLRPFVPPELFREREERSASAREEAIYVVDK